MSLAFTVVIAASVTRGFAAAGLLAAAILAAVFVGDRWEAKP